MIRYITDSLRTSLHKKYTYAYLGGIVVLCLLANFAILGFRSFYGMSEGTLAYNLVQYAEGCFVIPYYSCIFIVDVIFGTYPNPRIKDKITKKLSRAQIYFGKIIASLLLGAIFAFVAFTVFIGVTCIFLGADGTIDWWVIMEFLEKVIVALPLWIAGISIANMFLFVFVNKRNAFIGFFVSVVAIPRLIMFFAAEPFEWAPFTSIVKVLITPEFNALQFYFTVNEGKNIILGLVYTAIASAIGLWAYYKRKF